MALPKHEIRREYRGYLAATQGRALRDDASPKIYALRIGTTVEFLRLLRRRRSVLVERFGADHPITLGEVAFTRDPAWLVNEAINRRAGWPEDPSSSRGSCLPVEGRFPKRAEDDGGSTLRNLAHLLNGNFYVRRREVPPRILRKLTPARLARLHDDNED